MECTNNIVGLYGFRAFLADIDRDRQFWRESDGLVASILDYAANDGFEEWAAEFFEGVEFLSAHEYRSRYLVATLKAMLKSRM